MSLELTAGGRVHKDIAGIAEEIRRYCATHPSARDSLEGITWWVQMQIRTDIRSSVADAGDVLVREGKLERHRLQDGSEVYGCKGPACGGMPGDTHA